MNKSLRWLRELVTENIGWKLLSLFIAVALWVVVASEPELSTFATVRLEYRNLPDELEVSSEPVATVALELRGPSGELGANGESVHPAVILDMSGIRKSFGGVPVLPGDIIIGDSDGVVVIPREQAIAVAEAAEAVFDDETTRRAAIIADRH